MSEFVYQPAVDPLLRGELTVIPTDTIYGIVARASDQVAVERLYRVRRRDPAKPFIILIADFEDLEKFAITLSPEERSSLEHHWPGPTSIILPCPDQQFEYLHRGTQSLSFRLPADDNLRDLIRQTGPLTAPSANPEGKEPAATIEAAKDYFGDSVAAYINVGGLRSKPSTLIQLQPDGSFLTLRK